MYDSLNPGYYVSLHCFYKTGMGIKGLAKLLSDEAPDVSIDKSPLIIDLLHLVGDRKRKILPFTLRPYQCSPIVFVGRSGS